MKEFDPKDGDILVVTISWGGGLRYAFRYRKLICRHTHDIPRTMSDQVVCLFDGEVLGGDIAPVCLDEDIYEVRYANKEEIKQFKKRLSL